VARLGELSSDLPERTVAPLDSRENVLQREVLLDATERPAESLAPAGVDRAAAAPPDLSPEPAVADRVGGNPEGVLPLRTVAPAEPELAPPKRRQAGPEVRSAVERVAAAGAVEFAAEERPGLSVARPAVAEPAVVEPCTAAGLADKPVPPARDRAEPLEDVALGNPAPPPEVDVEALPARERAADPD